MKNVTFTGQPMGPTVSRAGLARGSEWRAGLRTGFAVKVVSGYAEARWHLYETGPVKPAWAGLRSPWQFPALVG